MGFYARGAIQPKIAKILDQRPQSVTFDSDTVKNHRAGSTIDQRIANAIQASLDGGVRSVGQPYRVFVLSHAERRRDRHPRWTDHKHDEGGVRPDLRVDDGSAVHATVLPYTPGISTTTELEQAGG